jgi:tetratricopeptide (TPR) repeat protein
MTRERLTLASLRAQIALSMDRIAEARELHRSALALARELGDSRREISLLSMLGMALGEEPDRDIDAARAALDAALTLAEAHGDDALIARTVYTAAQVAYIGGDLDTTESLLRRALDLYAGTGNLRSPGMIGLFLAEIQAFRGDPAAVATADEAYRVLEDLGNTFSIADATMTGAIVRVLVDDLSGVDSLLRRAMLDSHAQRRPNEVATGVQVAGILAGKRAEWSRVALLDGSLSRLSLTAPVPRLLELHREAAMRARAVLGDAGFDEAYRRGAALPVPELAELVGAAS